MPIDSSAQPAEHRASVATTSHNRSWRLRVAWVARSDAARCRGCSAAAKTRRNDSLLSRLCRWSEIAERWALASDGSDPSAERMRARRRKRRMAARAMRAAFRGVGEKPPAGAPSGRNATGSARRAGHRTAARGAAWECSPIASNRARAHLVVHDGWPLFTQRKVDARWQLRLAAGPQGAWGTTRAGRRV